MAYHALQSSDPHSSKPDVLDIPLNGSSFIIHKFLRSESHADVYSVRSDSAGMPLIDVVARAYILDDIHPKIRNYRLKNIKRLTRRSIFEAKCRGATVVVIREGPLSSLGDENPTAGPETGVAEPQKLTEKRITFCQDTSTDEHTTGGPPPKTLHQKESSRVRQLERRKARRTAVKLEKDQLVQKDGNNIASFAPEKDEATNLADDRTFAMCVILHLAHDKEGNPLQKTSPEISALLKNSPGLVESLGPYFDAEKVDFPDLKAMEYYAEVKMSELISLRRGQSKIPSLYDHYNGIVQVQAQQVKDHSKGSEEWCRLQNSVKDGIHHLLTIKHAQNILPRLINNVERVCKDIKEKIAIARAREEEMERIHELKKERNNIELEIANYTSWGGTVVPSTHTQTRMEEKKHALLKELKEFDIRHPDLNLEPETGYNDLLSVLLR